MRGGGTKDQRPKRSERNLGDHGVGCCGEWAIPIGPDKR
jgi:hypothetical protein